MIAQVYLKMGYHRGDHFYHWGHGYQRVPRSLIEFVNSTADLLRRTSITETFFEIIDSEWIEDRHFIRVGIRYDINEVLNIEFPCVEAQNYVVNLLFSFFYEHWQRRLDEYYEHFVKTMRLRNTKYYPVVNSIRVILQ